MSDVPPPPGDLPEAESATEAGGLWHRYRSLPVPLQILVPLVVLALIIGGIVWATSGSDGDDASSETTTASGDSALAVVIKGLIVTGDLADSSVPTTETESTPAPTSNPTKSAEAPATTEAATTTEPATTEAPTTTTEPATTEATTTTTTEPTTTATTEATTTEATTKPTTEATTKPTTEATTTTTTEATTTTTTTVASPALPSVADFFAEWNDATTGTDVPEISGAQAMELTGQYAGYYLIPLTANGSTEPPQVGLVGRVSAPGSGQLDVVMLVWIPGSDEDSSTFYWNCFGVLVQAVSPGATPDQITDLATSLGEEHNTPPFAGTTGVTSGGLDYRAFTLPYKGKSGTVDVSVIEVSAS
jgi:outer membrane biosynthesis protein TonB